MKYSCFQPYNPIKGGPEILVIWDHPSHGLIHFLASPNDVEEHGREIYNEALDGEYGLVISYEDSHWYSTVNDNVWNNVTYKLGQLMISPSGEQPPNSTQTPPSK
jgi:hypothetical protein